MNGAAIIKKIQGVNRIEAVMVELAKRNIPAEVFNNYGEKIGHVSMVDNITWQWWLYCQI
jgi:hypothetical protein